MTNRGKLKVENLKEVLSRNSQDHVLSFLEQLSPEEQRTLLSQLEGIDISFFRREILRLRRPTADGGRLRPAPCTLLPSSPTEEDNWERAYRTGEETIRRGEIAVVTIAGGQGSRFGSVSCKGFVPITPVRGKPFFQLFAERILAAEARYSISIPWLILVSPEGKKEAIEFFSKRDFFGLKEVHIFSQGQMPLMDRDGKLILSARTSFATHPDGNGGLLLALNGNGLFTTLARLGIKHLSSHPVDNPLALPLDPYFVGFHLLTQSQMSCRCVRKAYAGERIGIFAESGGKLRVIEPPDLPPECASAMDVSNRLRFGQSNASLHLFEIAFLEQFSRPDSDGRRRDLPLHISMRKVPFLNDAGHLVLPTEPNALKMERSISDLLSFADRALLLEGRREEIFSPVKNQLGLDSPETSRRDQVRLFANWLALGKVDMLRDEGGTPPFAIEIAPSFADSAREFLAKWSRLEWRPAVVENFYLE
ncbi:MAG: UTP--glucose-1-phosphate uridylyltransferase [Puniceicoccales bacterium]|jgi:UDP-N-acetylglucosamine/UDP-N-acetylgalactosamine diphosphorylase|nr:UTP--glucose-1-phosphate uridylyltransferase [Puniceicoccales bacterium]